MLSASRLLLIAILFVVSYQTQAARYWVATRTSNWNNPANWSTTSGGAGGATVPGASGAVTFDINGQGNCTMTLQLTSGDHRILWLFSVSSPRAPTAFLRPAPHPSPAEPFPAVRPTFLWRQFFAERRHLHVYHRCPEI